MSKKGNIMDLQEHGEDIFYSEGVMLEFITKLVQQGKQFSVVANWYESAEHRTYWSIMWSSSKQLIK
jgi:fatty acid-binding protein DegV